MLQFMWLQGIGPDLVTEQQHQMHYEKREKKMYTQKVFKAEKPRKETRERVERDYSECVY